jgi:hypothetical protein
MEITPDEATALSRSVSLIPHPISAQSDGPVDAPKFDITGTPSIRPRHVVHMRACLSTVERCLLCLGLAVSIRSSGMCHCCYPCRACERSIYGSLTFTDHPHRARTHRTHRTHAY